MTHTQTKTQAKTNILFFATKLNSGGAERVVAQLANLLCEKYSIHILTIDDLKENDYYVSEKVIKKSLGKKYQDPLISYLQENKIEIVFDCYHWSTNRLKFVDRILDSLTENVKYVICDHNQYFYPLYTHDYALFHMRNRIYKKLSAVVVLNDFSKNMYELNDCKNVIKIPNPLSYSSNDISDLTSKNVISIGNFKRKEKNLDGLLKAFKEIHLKDKEIILNIVGSVPNNLNAMINSHDIPHENIILHGFINDVSSLYLKCSLILMCSKIEGFPMVIVESFIHGLPVVAYNIYGMEDIIHHGENGYICKQDDTEDFSQRVIYLLENKELLREFSKNAMDFCKNELSNDVIINQWVNFIDELLTDNFIKNNFTKNTHISNRVVSDMERKLNEELNLLAELVVKNKSMKKNKRWEKLKRSFNKRKYYLQNKFTPKN